MLRDIIDKAFKRAWEKNDFNRKTIGVDMSFDDIQEAITDELVLMAKNDDEPLPLDGELINEIWAEEDRGDWPDGTETQLKMVEVVSRQHDLKDLKNEILEEINDE